MPLLSLVVPVYNEGATLEAMLRRLGTVAFPIPWEAIVVDDGSDDDAVESVKREWLPTAERVLVVRSHRNQGKGAAVRKGFELARGDVLGVQDADLETHPEQIPELIRPILDGDCEVVFGTRQFDLESSFSFWYVVGNRLLSLATSALFNRHVRDPYTCYKFFTRDRYEDLRLTADGFEIEAEIAGGLLRSGAVAAERPVVYVPRSRHEGKKIGAMDGLRGLLRLARVRVRGW